MEIERKFLITQPPADLETHPREPINQGYLLTESMPGGAGIRVRRKADHFFLTIKHGHGLSRTEVELPLPPADFEALWPLTEGCRVEKTRYFLPHTDSVDQSHTIELDVYAGALAGLLTAEVEFPTEEAAHAFQPPAFFGRELTDDPAYTNAALARHGLPGSPGR